jgi:hypothetical protein
LPQQCGVDPDDETDGFESVDPAYAIRATQFTMIGAGPIERDVVIPLEILAPGSVRAVAFSLELGTPALTLDTPFFESAMGPELTNIANLQEGSRLHVVLGPTCGPLLVAGDSEWQPLGTLRLHLQGTTLPSPILWLPEATINGVVHRATVVGGSYRDHHPRLLAGERFFQRGNANNGGITPVDYGDPIFLLYYLAGIGPDPTCLDAGDANNDGKLDYADPITLLYYLVGEMPPMPYPFPACDFESDIDELDCEEYECI